MMQIGVRFVLLLTSLVLTIVAAILWALSRPSMGITTIHRDLDTLVAGAISSQIIISIGLILSALGDGRLDKGIYCYFLITVALVMVAAGAVLLYLAARRRTRIREMPVEFQVATDRPFPTSLSTVKPVSAYPSGIQT